MGDWYLYQNHTKIRIYGCHLAPYKLPKYLPVRLFYLEYYRQIMNYDGYFIRVKNELGPFIYNSREAGHEADLIL